MPEATVIVPTHEHATTLPHAVRSALRQTVADIELVIIGDGATEDTRSAAETLAASDPRVRFEAHPKSPGQGFLYRHEAVRQAKAEAVFYLSDDDLWYPEHIEMVGELLRSAEFAVALTISVSPDRPRIKSPTDLTMRHYQDKLRERAAIVQLSATAHTREGYRRVPLGWRVTDPEHSDFWREFVTTPGLRLASAPRPTVLQFTSPPRADMTPEDRAAELERWEPVLTDSSARLELTELILASELRRSARLSKRLTGTSRKLARARARARERR